MKTLCNNPILSGFYPDPTMCRVNDDYYLCASTFCYYPGVPIFHSTDLVNWKQIGNVLDRPSQVPLKNPDIAGTGIYAPTLRYHDGTFYMITTNVGEALGNFIVTAKDPAGPWSEPYPLESEGIDPSLFFDDDGKCYYCGTKPRREGARYFGDNEIYIQELDLNTMKLTGESYPAWHGALRGVEWPEGPHIYKINGWYYLLISEAGTGHMHSVTIARSKSLFEPFEGYPGNPILTHRHLGINYPIVNVGHPDIVQTQNGECGWYVLLQDHMVEDITEILDVKPSLFLSPGKTDGHLSILAKELLSTYLKNLVCLKVNMFHYVKRMILMQIPFHLTTFM